MKRTIIALIGLLCTFSQASLLSSDIEIWTGTGANQSILVIDWNSGPTPQSLAWGFRWEGSATAEEALRTVVTADPRLDWQVGTASDFGLPLYGLSYDLNNNGIIGSGNDESMIPTDPGDLHANGWLTAGFWALYLGGRSDLPNWQSATTGISGYNLVAGDWIGLSFGPAPTWDGGAPDEPIPATVPEPISLTLLLTGTGGLLTRRSNPTRIN